jgi:hypothetical protein
MNKTRQTQDCPFDETATWQEVCHMGVSFDIFRMGHEGEVIWVETAATLKDARERVQTYASLSPAVYFVLGQPSGDLEIIEFAGPNEVARSAPSSAWVNN